MALFRVGCSEDMINESISFIQGMSKDWPNFSLVTSKHPKACCPFCVCEMGMLEEPFFVRHFR